jgi:hypothetical protein
VVTTVDEYDCTAVHSEYGLIELDTNVKGLQLYTE